MALAPASINKSASSIIFQNNTYGGLGVRVALVVAVLAIAHHLQLLSLAGRLRQLRDNARAPDEGLQAVIGDPGLVAVAVQLVGVLQRQLRHQVVLPHVSGMMGLGTADHLYVCLGCPVLIGRVTWEQPAPYALPAGPFSA